MLHYTGFRNLGVGREYDFSLSGSSEVPARSFTILIVAAAFGPGMLKFQEGPGLCYGKLQAALAGEEANGPVCSTQRVTETDVEQFRTAGRINVRKWTDEQRLAAKQRAKANRTFV